MKIQSCALFFLCLLFLGVSCEASIGKVDSDNISPKNVLPEISISTDTAVFYSFGDYQYEVKIRVPDVKAIGSILILQGWNFASTSWCDSSTLCESALDKGYVLICPDMGKSIYALKIYPETRTDWKRYPTRKWLSTTVFKGLQEEFNLLMPGENNCIIGLSTGGRGAVLMAIDHPEIFKAAASLSGDFDQCSFTKDNLCKGFFGAYSENIKRWCEDENPLFLAKKLQVPLYIAHGIDDAIVPVIHSERLMEVLSGKELKKTAIKHKLVLSSDKGHNYEYWNSEVKNILSFFQLFI